MKLYHSSQSRSVRPRWLLEELGVPYELVKVDLGAGENKRPDYLKIHPHGAVPALVDEDVALRVDRDRGNDAKGAAGRQRQGPRHIGVVEDGRLRDVNHARRATTARGRALAGDGHGRRDETAHEQRGSHRDGRDGVAPQAAGAQVSSPWW